MMWRSIAFVACSTAFVMGMVGSALALPPIDIDRPIPTNPRPVPPVPPTPTPTPPGQQEVRIPASLIAIALEGAFQGTQIRLNNHGPRQGNSWHRANDSWIRLSPVLGSTEQRFNIPETVKDLDCGLVCPDLGDAKFYVNDVNLADTEVNWQAPTFRLTFFFEDSGREIKGYHTGSLTSLGDDGMPDANIDNAQLSVVLQPTALNGRLTYQLVSVTFSGDIQATGPCDVLGMDVCDTLFDYKARIRSTVESSMRSRLSDPALRDRVADALEPVLANLNTGPITGVRGEGNNLVIQFRPYQPSILIDPIRLP